jgi:transcriptional regulator GlxA family with amidase domain
VARAVGILLFRDVEVLDFAGPLEVFSAASRVALRLAPDASPPFDVFTVAVDAAPVHARAGLAVVPNHTFTDHPSIDVLVVPGGDVRAPLACPATLRWLEDRAAHAEVTASVCTGAFLLGACGLLDGRDVTTHHEDLDGLAEACPTAQVHAGRRWIDSGAVVTAAGVAAGLDMSLHLVERFAGAGLAAATARYVELDAYYRSSM